MFECIILNSSLIIAKGDHSTLNIQHSTLKIHHSKLKIQHYEKGDVEDDYSGRH
jgi:hypothetical protein